MVKKKKKWRPANVGCLGVDAALAATLGWCPNVRLSELAKDTGEQNSMDVFLILFITSSAWLRKPIHS